MSFFWLFQWLNQTPVSIFIRRSTWVFAVIEMVHLLGLAILGGAILIGDLSLLGIGLRHERVLRLEQELFPVVLASLSVMLISGTLLMTTWPMRYYENPAFRLKMLFLLLAITFHFALHWKIVCSEAKTRASVWSKGAAIVSLGLWLSVGLAGRAIGIL